MATSSRAQTSTARRSLTRFATVSTRQLDEQVARTVKRCRLPFSGNVRDLIRRAAGLVAPLTPFRVTLTSLPRDHQLGLSCGVDEHGVHTRVSVTLHPSDVAGLLTYFARARSMICLLLAELPDDGDGQDLSVPRVNVDELAQMLVPAMGLLCDAPHVKGGA